MAQQEAPAVGTVMDGYRFKGGDPAQESSWEQVAPVDVSDRYGAGARQLPNGVIERVGPRGGVQRVGAANGGGGQGGASPMVGADARARFMINLGPLQESQAVLESMDAEGYDPSSLRNAGASALEAIPFDGGFAARVAGGGDYNAYNQAAKTFEAAILPIMSGAAVTPTEAQRLIRAALPQPGDSPEVLAQKARQRRQMINAVASGIGQQAPYDMNALPDYNGPEGFNIVGETNIDANGRPYTVANQEDLAPGDTPESLRAQGYEQDPQTGNWFRYIAPEGGASPPPDGPPPGGGGSGGPDQTGGSSGPEAEAARSGQGEGFVRKLDAAVRGAADFVTFGTADEIAAGANALLPLDRGSQGFWQNEDGFGGAYRHNVGMQRGIDAADARDVPVSRASGQIVGGVAAAPRSLAQLGAQSLRRAIPRGAAAGAAYGAAYGFGSGEGEIVDRLDNAAGGAAVGAAGGAAAPVVARAAAPILRPIGNALSGGARVTARPFVNAMGDSAPAPLREFVTPPNALTTAVDRFAGRSPQDVNALSGAAQGYRDQNIAPAFVDAINDGGRGTIRALASRQTPARDMAREFAEGRAEALPSRISIQSRRIVSPDNRPVDDIVGGLRSDRSRQAREGYGAVNEMVPLDPQTAAALSGAPGRAAIQRARAAAEAFQDAGSMAELDALAGGQAQEVSALTMDRLRQAMSGRAEQLSRNPGTRAVGAGLGQRAGQVDDALEGVEGLAPAREAYRQSSQQIEATEMGGRFMGAHPDDFVNSVQGLTPEQMSPVRSAMARNIEISARNPGSAPGVARRLYADPETRRMSEAALGQDAPRLADAMRAEAQVVRNAADINPRAGSQTSLNQQDALGAAGQAIGAGRELATGNVPALATRAINLVRGRGFSDREAEALVSAAIDPARTDEVISLLAQRMSRREARNLTRAIRHQATVGITGGLQGSPD